MPEKYIAVSKLKEYEEKWYPHGADLDDVLSAIESGELETVEVHQYEHGCYKIGCLDKLEQQMGIERGKSGG